MRARSTASGNIAPNTTPSTTISCAAFPADAVYDDLMRRISGIDKQKQSAQMSLFGEFIKEEPPQADYPDIPEWDVSERLAKEKSILGVYVSGHPFERYVKYFKDCSFNCSLLADFETDEETGDKTYHQLRSGQSATMGGIVSAIKKLNTKAGAVMAFVTVEDLYGSVRGVHCLSQSIR